MYLNFWTGATLANLGAAAYSTQPGGPNNLDGIVILADYVGRIGTSSPSHARVLTHEIGHFLNLQHCWGNTNNPGVACGNDGVLAETRSNRAL